MDKIYGENREINKHGIFILCPLCTIFFTFDEKYGYLRAL